MAWRIDRPNEESPGDHVFALVVYTETGEVGVRSMERAEVRSAWGKHVFAWQQIVYPTFTMELMDRAVARYQELTQAGNRHRYVAGKEGDMDVCGRCGRDLRDDVHVRVNESR